MSWHPPYTLINTWRHGVQGRAAQGMQQMRQELETYEANNAKLALPYYLGLMAGLCQRAGDTAAAIATVTRAIAVGPETPDFWLASFEAQDAGNRQYDPGLDPAADTYGVPADAFVAPDFVLRFFVDPDAKQKTAVDLRAAQHALTVAQFNLTNTQDAFDQATAALAAQQVAVRTAQRQVNAATAEVIRRTNAVAAQAERVAEFQDIADAACVVPLNLACGGAQIALQIERDKLQDRQDELNVAQGSLIAANGILASQESILAQRQAELALASQELLAAQAQLTAAEAALTAAEVAVAAVAEAAVDPGESLSGFHFRSFFGPAEIPALVVSSNGDLLIDPLGPRTSSFPQVTTSSLPEPGTSVLLAIGLAGLGCVRRRRRASTRPRVEQG